MTRAAPTAAVGSWEAVWAPFPAGRAEGKAGASRAATRAGLLAEVVLDRAAVVGAGAALARVPVGRRAVGAASPATEAREEADAVPFLEDREASGVAAGSDPAIPVAANLGAEAEAGGAALPPEDTAAATATRAAGVAERAAAAARGRAETASLRATTGAEATGPGARAAAGPAAAARAAVWGPGLAGTAQGMVGAATAREAVWGPCLVATGAASGAAGSDPATGVAAWAPNREPKEGAGAEAGAATGAAGAPAAVLGPCLVERVAYSEAARAGAATAGVEAVRDPVDRAPEKAVAAAATTASVAGATAVTGVTWVEVALALCQAGSSAAAGSDLAAVGSESAAWAQGPEETAETRVVGWVPFLAAKAAPAAAAKARAMRAAAGVPFPEGAATRRAAGCTAGARAAVAWAPSRVDMDLAAALVAARVRGSRRVCSGPQPDPCTCRFSPRTRFG